MKIYGYADKIDYPKNKFEPFVVVWYKDHLTDVYGWFHYYRHGPMTPDSARNKRKEGANYRHWEIRLYDKAGEYASFFGRFDLHLPYPSIWSSKYQGYWKWTKNYALKYYDWDFAYGQPTGLFYRFDDFQSVDVSGDFDEFGPCIHFRNNGHRNYADIYLRFY